MYLLATPDQSEKQSQNLTPSEASLSSLLLLLRNAKLHKKEGEEETDMCMSQLKVYEVLERITVVTDTRSAASCMAPG